MGVAVAFAHEDHRAILQEYGRIVQVEVRVRVVLIDRFEVRTLGGTPVHVQAVLQTGHHGKDQLFRGLSLGSDPAQAREVKFARMRDLHLPGRIGGQVVDPEAYQRVAFSGLGVFEGLALRVEAVSVQVHAVEGHFGFVETHVGQAVAGRAPVEKPHDGEFLFVHPVDRAVDDAAGVSVVGNASRGAVGEVLVVQVVVFCVGDLGTVGREGRLLDALVRYGFECAAGRIVKEVKRRVGAAEDIAAIGPQEDLALVGTQDVGKDGLAFKFGIPPVGEQRIDALSVAVVVQDDLCPAARPFEQGVVLSVGCRTQRTDASGGVHPPENVFEDQGIRCLGTGRGSEYGKDAQEPGKESSHKVKILHDAKLGKNGQ